MSSLRTLKAVPFTEDESHFATVMLLHAEVVLGQPNNPFRKAASAWKGWLQRSLEKNKGAARNSPQAPRLQRPGGRRQSARSTAGELA